METHGILYLTSDEDVLLDANYRYKIHALTTTSQIKKGTSITILDNFDKFCRELMFDKDLLIKIIGKALCCRSGTDTNNKYYLQGKYTEEQVKSVVYNFIQKYILCVNCDKPEVDLKHKNNKIKQKCRACGNNSYLEHCNEDIVKIFSRTR